MNRLPENPLALFEAYMRLYGTPTLAPEPGEPGLAGKTLGIVNGSAWTTLWSMYFGRLHLPGVKLVNVGNEAVQLNFMAAHAAGEPCPPESNIRCFQDYAADLLRLCRPDALLLTCSTMNRASASVRRILTDPGVPLVQIDEPMMEEAAVLGGRTLVIATHGPTVANTQALLQETAARLARPLTFTGATVEDAFHLLGEGRIHEHNELIARTIDEVRLREPVDSVVLAQLSMSVFALTYPDAPARFGVPVLTGGDCGFRRVRELLLAMPRASSVR